MYLVNINLFRKFNVLNNVLLNNYLHRVKFQMVLTIVCDNNYDSAHWINYEIKLFLNIQNR